MLATNDPIVNMSDVYARILSSAMSAGGVPVNVMNSVPTADDPSKNVLTDIINGAFQRASTGQTANKPLPQLLGAKAQVTGGAGGWGLAHGIGQALGNIYNSRIARSENEVAQAQHEADMAAKEAANKQARADEIQAKKDLMDYEEETPTSKLRRQNIQSEIDSRAARDARMAAKASGGSLRGGSGNGSSGTEEQVDPKTLSDADLEAMGVNVKAFRTTNAKGQQQILRNVAGRRAATSHGSSVQFVEYENPNTGDKEKYAIVKDKDGNQKPMPFSQYINMFQDKPQEPTAKGGSTMDDKMKAFLNSNTTSPTQAPAPVQAQPPALQDVGEGVEVYQDPVDGQFKTRKKTQPVYNIDPSIIYNVGKR